MRLLGPTPHVPTPPVVEFVGLPGAGKTTLAQEVIEELRRHGCRCFGNSTLRHPESVHKKSGGVSSKLRTLARFLASCLAHRRTAINAFLYAMQVNRFNLVTLRRLFIFLVRYRFVRELMDDDHDLLILDQGPIQNLWSIATTGREPRDGTYLGRALNAVLDELSPFVVMVHVDAALAGERIARRSTMRSRFDRMSRVEAQTLLAEHERTFADFISLADGFTRTGFLRVDGSDPIQTNVELILPLVERARQTHGV
jgi:thymidylate kinase